MSFRRSLSPFFRSSISMGLGTGTRLLLSMIKTKVAAIVLGAEGVGVIGLVGQLQMFGATLSTFLLGNGLSQMLSQTREKNDPKATSSILATAFTSLVVLNALFVAFLAVWKKPLADVFLGNQDHFPFLLPLMISVPVHSFLGTWVTALLFSHQRVLDYTKASICGAVVEVSLFVFLLRHYGIQGALWGVAAGLTAWLVCALFLISRFFPFWHSVKFEFHRGHAKELFTVGSTMSVIGLLGYGTNAAIRSHFLQETGAANSGVYHVAIVFTSLYMPFLTNALWSQLHPTVSAKGLSESARRGWTEAVLFMAAFGSLVQTGVTCFSPWLIRLLYTPEFLPAIRYIPIFMLGDFFYLVAQPSLAVFLALKQWRAYTVLWAAFYLIQLAGTVWLTPTFGLMGAAYAYLAASTVLGTAGLWRYAITVVNAKIVFENSLLVLSCLGVLASAVMLERYGSGLVPRILLVACWGAAVSVGYFYKPFRERLFR